jgi:hypothetical protein
MSFPRGSCRRVSPVRALGGISLVVDETARARIELDQLGQYQPMTARACISAVAGDLLLEREQEALHQQAGPGRKRALLAVGHRPLYGYDNVRGNDRLDGGAGTDICGADKGDKKLNCERGLARGPASIEEMRNVFMDSFSIRVRLAELFDRE